MDNTNEEKKRSESSLFTSRYCGCGIDDQREGESDDGFKRRVAGELRSSGRLIEAHECMNGARYDDEANGKAVMDGLMGAVAIAVQGVPYGANRAGFGNPAEDGERIIGDEYVAGAYLRHKRENPDPPLAAYLLALGINPFEVGG